MQDEYVKVCPYCGGTEMTETCNAYATAASVSPGGSMFKAAKLYHAICLKCGSVVRSYVKQDSIKKLK